MNATSVLDTGAAAVAPLCAPAIAKAVGVDPKTVRNDLATGGADAPPDRITGTDGKSYPATRPPDLHRTALTLPTEDSLFRRPAVALQDAR